MNAVARTCLGGVLALSLAAPALAQESKSVPLVKQLATALDEAKLTSIAVKDPSQPDTFIAALYYPGSMLLVVSAKMPAPAAMTQRIAKKDYQDAYVDLQSASDHESKVFIQDAGADGLRPKSFDSIDTHDRSVMFDGDWKKQKFSSEQDYLKAFDDADVAYGKMLTALLGGLKKTS